MELKDSIRVNIPDEVLHKIKYLCRQVPDREWSGPLFYTTEHSIKDPKTLVINIQDILLMDINKPQFTTFKWDGDFVDYKMNHENEEAMDWHVGLIHSHNRMSVFFSGEDWDELNENCDKFNYYLSMIVNNAGDIEAKIAIYAEPPQSSFSCKDEDGEDYNLDLVKPLQAPKMLVFDCDIAHSVEILTVSDKFTERLMVIQEKTEIRDKAEAEAEKNKPKEYKAQGGIPPVKGKDSSAYKSRFPDYKKDYDPKKYEAQSWEDFNRELENSNDIEDKTEQFAAFVLRLGTRVTDDTLEVAVDDLIESDVTGASLAGSILEYFGAFYAQFFDKDGRDVNDIDGILETIEDIVIEYELYEDECPKLKPVVMALKSYGNKISETILNTTVNGNSNS